MIDRVTIEESTYADLPQRFEAGTPPIVETIGLGAAIDFVLSIERSAIRDHEYIRLCATKYHSLLRDLTLIGTAICNLGLFLY